MVGGPQRANFEQHKDLVIKLYQEKMPWAKIKEIILSEHGCTVKVQDDYGSGISTSTAS